MMNTTRRLLIVGSVGLMASFGGCSDDGDGSGGAGNGTGTGASSTTANNSGGAGGSTGSFGGGNTGGNGFGGDGVIQPPTEIAPCQGHVYECGDLVDNDMDGLLDTVDPDCLGPCDDTEDSFYGGIPGQMGPPCAVDCYFDQDSGAGNDDCYWDHRCDMNEVATTYYPEPKLTDQCEFQGDDYVVGMGQTCADLDDAQSQDCYDYCGPLTPNGCDCFGCCEIPPAPTPVWLGSIGADGTTVCTIAELENPAVCHPCQIVTSCFNDCGPCEVCIGQPPPGPECGEGGAGGGGSTGQCDPGVQVCGLPGQDPCPADFSCITGCCIPIPT